MTMSQLAVDAPAGYRVRNGLLVPARQHTRPLAIDLFSGAGGFSMGFHQAGFHVIAAMDFNNWAAITYLVNLGRSARWGGVRMHFDTQETGDRFEQTMQKHLGLKPPGGKNGLMSASAQYGKDGNLTRGPLLAGDGWIGQQPDDDQRHGCEHYFFGDIRNFTGQQILDAIGVDSDDVSAIIGGPPCQGFSAAGKRDVMDPRNSLVFEFARIVCEVRPRTFVMENVPTLESMVTPEGIPVLDAFAVAVSEGGYGEYDSLRRALAGTGGRAAVRDSKRAKRHDGTDRADQPTRKAKAAAAAASDGQLDLFGGAA